MSFTISPSPRVRRSPFYEATVADGVVSFTSYNHMLMPTSYGDPGAEYDRLINHVSMWDVAVERQVQLKGPDAGKLAQVLTPRKLDKLTVGRGWYVAICDHRGVILNDPILLRVSDDQYWLSIADSDVLFWARAVAGERNLDVEITEPDVSPLAIQGPKAADVVGALFGDTATSLGHFAFREMSLEGIPLVVARSGWSKQGGYELYLMDGSKGTDLWNLVKQAGEPFGIGPGTPNPSERVESGLLSWGGDTDDETNPFEVRMERYIDLDAPDDVIGIDALRRIKRDGIKRHQLGVQFDYTERFGLYDRASQILKDGSRVGAVTAHAWSPRLERNIGLALVDRSLTAGDAVDITLPDGTNTSGTLCELPFI